MKIMNRLYPYPVLCDDNDDYNSSSKFDIICTQEIVDKTTVLFSIDINLEDRYLESLINEKKAVYIIHFECSNTSFRRVKRSHIKTITESINVDEIANKLEVVVFIVLETNISKFISGSWHEDYANMSFDLDAGSILAYKNLETLDIHKNREEFFKTNSIFTIQKIMDPKNTYMNVDMEYENINIRLSQDQFDYYHHICKYEKFQPILNAMIVFPALVFVFEVLSQDGAIATYEGKAWYQVLAKKFEGKGDNIVERIDRKDMTSIELAQEILELPLNSALQKFTDFFDKEDEEVL